MTKIQASRLLTLAYFLKTQVHPKHFDMGSYWSDQPRERGVTFDECLERPQCGTTACACGWGAFIFNDVRPGYFGESCGLSKIDNFADWDHLFGGHHVRTPKQEAAVIEKFCRDKGWVYAD